MKELESSRAVISCVEDGQTVIVTNLEAGRLLSNSDKLALLCPFLTDVHTVKEIAELLGLTLNAAYFQIQRFCRAGLLEVSHEVPRAGRSVKVYKASATAFFVPLQLLGGETRETLLSRDNRLWENKLVKGILKAETFDERSCGVRIALGDEGKLTSGFVTSPDGERDDETTPDKPAVFDTWLSLNLTKEVAKALQHDLDRLSLKYQKLYDDDHGKPYVVRLAVAPQD